MNGRPGPGLERPKGRHTFFTPPHEGRKIGMDTIPSMFRSRVGVDARMGGCQ
jgi:hypothetical protein